MLLFFEREKAFIKYIKRPTSAVKFGSIVVSFCAAEMGRTKIQLEEVIK